jgi:lysophospholipase L1-like esterase
MKRTLVSLYLAFSLPILALCLTESVRFALTNKVAELSARVVRPKVVFVGDSITAGGRSWFGLARPLGALNLARVGFELRQMQPLMKAASEYHPRHVVFMGGSNDVAHGRTDEEIMRDFDALLPHASIVTLIPMQKPENAERIARLNSRMRWLAEARALPVIDLNPLIAQDGALKAEYTTDGLHFSDAAYALWKRELKRVM